MSVRGAVFTGVGHPVQIFSDRQRQDAVPHPRSVGPRGERDSGRGRTPGRRARTGREGGGMDAAAVPCVPRVREGRGGALREERFYVRPRHALGWPDVFHAWRRPPLPSVRHWCVQYPGRHAGQRPTSPRWLAAASPPGPARCSTWRIPSPLTWCSCSAPGASGSPR